MAADSGILDLVFESCAGSWDALNEYIAEKIKELTAEGRMDQHRVTEWSFLLNYDPIKHKLFSQYVISDCLEFDTIETFAMELVEKLDHIGFSGIISHGWLITDGPDTEIEFSHAANSKKLCWHCMTGEKEPDGDDELVFGENVDEDRWVWDSETREKKHLTKRT